MVAAVVNTFLLAKYFLKNIGWLDSKYYNEPVNSKNQPIPWFTYSSINFLNRKLNDSKFDVLEFGSGNSTLWFSKRVKNIISVEHNKNYIEKINEKKVSHPNIKIVSATPGKDYFQQINKFSNVFDVIIVDGEERNECIINSLTALKRDGIIICDDTETKICLDGQKFLEEKNFKRIDFYGMAPIVHFRSQTTVFYRNDNCFNI